MLLFQPGFSVQLLPCLVRLGDEQNGQHHEQIVQPVVDPGLGRQVVPHPLRDLLLSEGTVTMGVVTKRSVGVTTAPISSATRNGTPTPRQSSAVPTANINAIPTPMMSAIHRTFFEEP